MKQIEQSPFGLETKKMPREIAFSVPFIIDRQGKQFQHCVRGNAHMGENDFK